MLVLIDSVPGGFCGSRRCRYISVMLSKCPSLPLGLFLSSPPDFSCCVRRAVDLEGNEDISTASCPGLFLYAKAPSHILSHRSPVVQCTWILFPPVPCMVALLMPVFFPLCFIFQTGVTVSAFVKQTEMYCAKFCIRACACVRIWAAEVAAGIVSRPKKPDLSLGPGFFPVRKT